MVRALVALASVLLVLAVGTGYVRHVVASPDQVANRAAAALRDERVRTLVAAKLTDEVVLANEEDLLAARPIIESVASSVVGSRAFTSLLAAAVRDVHRAVLDRDQDTVTLTIADVGTVLAGALEQLQPDLARQVEATDRIALFERSLGDVGGAAVRVVDRVELLAWLLAAGFVLSAAAALALSRDRRRTVVDLGVGAVIGGVVLAVLCVVGRGIVEETVGGPDQRAAARAVWDAFLGDLRTLAWVLAGCGAVVVGAAASLLRPVAMGAPVRALGRRIAAEPSRPAWRVVRALALAVVGVLLVARPEAVLILLVRVAGVYLVYEAVTAILRLTYRPREEAPARERRRVIAVPVAVVAVLGAVVVAFVGGGGTTTAAPARGTCNGSASLCAKPFDEVALAATHNSMSVPLPGWFAAEQDAPIATQLREGVRGLLIDTHYGDRLPSGRVRTVLGPNSKPRQAADGLGDEAFEAALRIRARVGFSGEGERGMYLCHTLCEVGATPVADVLDDVHDFLVANPGEVLVIVNQDEVKPADFVAAVREADLEQYVYRGSTTDWPTLGSMVDSGQRLVVLAENEAGAAPWYHLAYEQITEETPFDFRSTAALTAPSGRAASCAPNRGPSGAPLFLINHWVSTDPTPRPSDATVVNARAPLLARVRACERLRDHLPTLLAVNFYRRGDVFAVVDELNR
jgi:hypothetical protein